jgi:hypothetical protein
MQPSPAKQFHLCLPTVGQNSPSFSGKLLSRWISPCRQASLVLVHRYVINNAEQVYELKKLAFSMLLISGSSLLLCFYTEA